MNYEQCHNCHKPIIDEDSACMHGGYPKSMSGPDWLFCSQDCELESYREEIKKDPELEY